MPLVRLNSIEALSTLDLDHGAIAILPVAATEAHGPHLPVSTDCDIAEGHLGTLERYLPSTIDAVVLPVQRMGASREHLWAEGTQSIEEAELMAHWFSICRALAGVGGRRVIIVSSHGGNTAVVDSVILKARAELSMLAIGTAWLRFGVPDGLFSDAERAHGIHGGDIETSLMLHYAPELVAMDKTRDFVSAQESLDTEMTHLSATGRHHFGWLSSDLNPLGVVGNASAATPEKGRALAHHILTGFADLLADTARFDLAMFDRH